MRPSALLRLCLWLRAGPLSDRRVIDNVTRSFRAGGRPPYKIRDAKDEAGYFVRAARTRNIQYQGIGSSLQTQGAGRPSGFQEPRDLDRRGWQRIRCGSRQGRHPVGAGSRSRKTCAPPTSARSEADVALPLACHMALFLPGQWHRPGSLDAALSSAKDFKEFAPPDPVKGKPGTFCSCVIQPMSVDHQNAKMPVP